VARKKPHKKRPSKEAQKNSLILLDQFTQDDWCLWLIKIQLPSNSLIFGRLIMEAGFEGVLYPSVKGKGKCIAIFPENLAGTDSYVELFDKCLASAS